MPGSVRPLFGQGASASLPGAGFSRPQKVLEFLVEACRAAGS